MNPIDPINLSKDTLILMNFGTLITLGGVLLKVVWAWAKADSELTQLRKDIDRTNQQLEKDVNAAHARIRDLEKPR